MRDKILAALLLVSCGGGYTNDGDACANIEGSCLSLRVLGTGTVDKLDVMASVKSAGGTTMTRVGDFTGSCELPCAYRVRPPSGVTAPMVSALRATLTRGALTYSQNLALAWSEGAHLAQTITPTFK